MRIQINTTTQQLYKYINIILGIFVILVMIVIIMNKEMEGVKNDFVRIA